MSVATRQPLVKSRRAVVLAVSAAALAFFIQFFYLRAFEQKLVGEYEMVPVLVAKKDLPAHTILDDSMVRVEPIPKKWVAKSAITDIDAMFGQMTATPIQTGEQVTQTRLITIAQAGLARTVPPGRRAVSVSVSRVTGVSGQIRPGNYVDVVGTFDFGDMTHKELKTITLFQNVEVLSVGDELMVDEGDGDGKRGGETYRDVSVAVLPDEAQRLVMAQAIGMLTLTLRKTGRGNVKPLRASDITELGFREKKKTYRRPYVDYEAGR